MTKKLNRHLNEEQSRLERARKFHEEHPEHEVLPGAHTLIKLGYGDLVKAMRGKEGFPAFREKLGQGQLMKPRGYWSNQSDEELIAHAKEHHQGSTKTELLKKNGTLYQYLWNRDLLETLTEKGILYENQKPRGYWSNQSDEELIAHTKEHHQGSTKEDLKREEITLYKHLQNRDLLETLIGKGIIHEVKKPNGFYAHRSDEELIAHTKEHHQGSTKTELSKENRRLYTLLQERTLLDSLVKEGVIGEGRKSNGYWSNQSDEELIAHTKEHHQGSTRSELIKKNETLYRHLMRRDLLVVVVQHGILIDKNHKNIIEQDQLEYLLETYVKGGSK